MPCVGAAGRGANLLLNVGPRPDGTIGPEFTERLLAVGKWLENYGKTVYGTRRGPIPPQPWGVTTQDLRAGHVYLHVLEGRQDHTAQELGSFIPFAFGKDTPLKLTQGANGMELTCPRTLRHPSIRSSC